ncbi:FAD-dependent oxidoreductase [Rhodocytophaga rosea]|uniref:FAD-dependent oxidoreductase n=1 Tax=Rhodocytophaga rosea TaxID=2704465 RepID=A0A6C0GEU3_9BACT|nr:NAD(P)/FAD-dependent oxidoreductase [Rhodocytophaga rosea]QHT66334.1 FAD-dependent oxidoreductase [Rhodocytophaga rosea]
MESYPVVIIGAGVAGLTCAHYLHKKQIPFILIESSADVGGRIWTDKIDGFLLDKGFQVFLTSYPEAKHILNYDSLDLKAFRSGAIIRQNKRFVKLVNPLKEPFLAFSALFSPVGSLPDKFRILQLTQELKDLQEDEIFAQKATSTLDFLKSYGWSEKMIDSFFKPFFGGVFLERELNTSSNFFRFVFKQFAASDAVLPAGGIQEIPRQLAASLPANSIRTNTPVKHINGSTVELISGEQIQARNLVVAVDELASAGLLGNKIQPVFNATSCIYFSANRSPLDTDMLVINSEEQGLINNLCVPSDIAPAYAPSGKALISVSIVKKHSFTEAQLVEKVKEELVAWYGNEVLSWQHLKTYSLPQALPAFPASEPAKKNLKWNDTTFICGDYMAYPSLNGAMATGRQVAESIAASGR